MTEEEKQYYRNKWIHNFEETWKEVKKQEGNFWLSFIDFKKALKRRRNEG